VGKEPPVAADDANKAPRPFDVRTIKTLVGLMTQHDLSEIDLHEGDHRIRLRRGTKLAVAAAPAPPPAAAPAPANNGAPPPAAEPAVPPKADKPAVTIKSPTPGTFYAAPSPDAPPYVTVGTRVTPASVVCTIEAMKIFNEIHAECSGVITKVLAQNAQPVEYGQVLFEVDPAG
jgi:acetyl-CoA carboxylase biotin carboxyl carrier protein